METIADQENKKGVDGAIKEMFGQMFFWVVGVQFWNLLFWTGERSTLEIIINQYNSSFSFDHSSFKLYTLFAVLNGTLYSLCWRKMHSLNQIGFNGKSIPVYITGRWLQYF